MHVIALALTSIFKPAIDYALPPRCPSCGEIVDGDRRLCQPCWSELEFIGPPYCAACHMPFAFDRGEDALCGQCLTALPEHDGVLAAIAYGDVARTLVVRLKYSRRIGLARMAAEQIERVLPDIDDGWTIIPVPLHRWRIWSRGFNQALLIARHIASRCAASVETDWVRRTRHTRPLKGAGRHERAKMVKGAFAVTSEGRAQIKGRNILLVDDVYTTGATTNAIAKVLKRTGAASVVVVCWSRVIVPDEGSE